MDPKSTPPSETPKKDLTEASRKSRESLRFIPNSQYFTIAVYTIIVVAICALIIRVIMTPHAVSNALWEALDVIMPFLIGTLLAFILNPIINRLIGVLHEKGKIENARVTKVLAMVIAYLFVMGFIAICIFFIVPQIIRSITEIINNLPQLYRTVYNFLNRLQDRFPDTDMSQIQTLVNDALPDAISTIRDFASGLIPALYSISVAMVTWILNIIIAIIVSAYMLSDKKNLINSTKRLLYSILPEKYIDRVLNIAKECYHIFTSFMVGKALDSLIIGIICLILMTIFRMDYALLISVIVGITNMIPYFGPFIGAIPGVLIMLISSPLEAFAFAVLILVLQQFDGLILGPKILGNSIGLKPLWIIIAITLGGKIAGVLGMFLSVPIAAMLTYIINIAIDYRLKAKANGTDES